MTDAATPADSRIITVRGGTDVRGLATAIVSEVGKGTKDIRVEYVGAGAGNQASKGMAVAYGILQRRGVTMLSHMQFVSRTSKENVAMTAMQIVLHIRKADT